MTEIDTGERRLIFLDETGCNLNLARRYGRAPKGVRPIDKSGPRNTPPNRSLVGALSQAGLRTSLEVEGSMDGDAFLVFLENCLGPSRRPGDVGLLDNLSTHKSKRRVAAIQAHGAEVVFLPRYSADFNPIEGTWSKVQSLPAKGRPPPAQSSAPRSGPWTGAPHRPQRSWLV